MKENQAKRQKEDRKRLESLMRGAFSGPPTPLKDIPKRRESAKCIHKKGKSDAKAVKS
jgi:hypothetical protein